MPLLADPPGESRHPWRLEPPRLPEQVFLAPWCLERLWSEGRSPRADYDAINMMPFEEVVKILTAGEPATATT